jgi:hypothetical protein
MRSFKALIIRSAPSLAAILLVSCAGGPSLNPPSGTIAGITVPKSKVVVRQEQMLKFTGLTYVLPAGEYRPAYEDAIGIYYEAPSKVIQRENFLGMHIPDRPFDGGIFLERANPQVSKIYLVAPGNEGGEIHRMLHGGRPYKVSDSPQPIQFQLIKS